MHTDIITLIANLALTLSLVVAIIFGLAQVKQGKRDRRERLTLETLRNFQTREFSALMLFVMSPENMPASQEAFRKLPNDDRITIIQFAQEMESLGILVAEKLIDIDLVDKTLGSFVTTTWEKYKPFFMEVRPTDPFLGEYFQWLAERIEERMRDNPRKPFFEKM